MRKRYLAPLLLSAMFFAACGGGEKKQTNTDSVSTHEAPAADNSMVSPNADKPVSKGETLMAQSDCKTCHKEEMKVVGPALKDIAGKYPNTPENVDKLADKVIKGGSGNWGEVAMLPHPQVSKDDAKEMVSYILSLKH
ncbi:c-type cytochrome [Chitinophaga polysaccharea]|uniref:c-type cytochrome n=1 Tax=Chitinophaga TaxID=79328 RepID=UPI0014557A3D|nr:MULTISPECIES: c-type cytochrome [Chitinophaga]NLR61743.1 c-type cytochrome [Chitinophaga polysaccharea]NLU92601.1 c-type cytochrome [Chitinophaga sp. Ak27]